MKRRGVLLFLGSAPVASALAGMAVQTRMSFTLFAFEGRFAWFLAIVAALAWMLLVCGVFVGTLYLTYYRIHDIPPPG